LNGSDGSLDFAIYPRTTYPTLGASYLSNERTRLHPSNDSHPRSSSGDSYEYRKGEYIIIENSELENLRVPSKHTIDVSQFVNLNELNPEFVEKPYFVVPENDSVEVFAVVRKALQKTGKVAIGKIAFSGREHVLAISPACDGDRGVMMAYTLRYTSELRNQSDYFRDIKPVEIGEESLELAESLIAKIFVE
jgi:DNA end-binding protein Ku